jgi:hypothetical protein
LRQQTITKRTFMEKELKSSKYFFTHNVCVEVNKNIVVAWSHETL